MFSQAIAQLIGKGLCRALNGIVACDFTRHANRIAEVNGEASWFYAIDEARQQRGAGQVAQQRRRSQEPRTPPQERHSHAIAAQMPVHKNGNHLVFAETPPNLESGVE